MNVSRRYPTRLVLALAAAALVLVIGAASAFGQQAAPSEDASGGGGGAPGSTGIGVGTDVAVSPPDVAVSSGMAMPAWCCGGATGSVPGLTTYGQATVDGKDLAARDAAIAAAVQDATAQANVAADAAGITLGPIIDMQVSAAPYYYDYPMMGTATGASGSSPGSPGGGGMEPAPEPGMFYGSVSVTITWSLG
jgi:Protein of unknown function (DUF541)